MRANVRQLSGMDSEFLAMESDAVVAHVGTVAVLEPPADGRTLDLQAVRDHLAARLHLAPILRRRLMRVMFGVDQPYWVDDPEFDLARHVHEVQLPFPGDEVGGVAALADTVAALHQRRLERDRPLWELHLITGLPDGQVALYLKIHHAVMDGAGWSSLLGVLLDHDPAPRDLAEPTAWHPETVPGRLELVGMSGWSMTRASLRSMKLGAEFMARAPGLATRALRPSGPGLLRFAPPTPFNQKITGARSAVFLDLPMDAVDQVRGRLGGTVNDVVMSLCAGALRHWLFEHDALPERSLISVVPVSVRPPQEDEPVGNRLALVRAPLPTHLSDPEQRLAATRAEMTRARQRRAALPPELLVDMAEYALPPFAEAGWWLSSRLMRRVNAFNVLISNVRGPAGPRYFAGAALIANYPVSVLVHGQGLNLSVFSVANRLCWGLVADPSLVPDLERIGDLLAEELVSLCRTRD